MAWKQPKPCYAASAVREMRREKVGDFWRFARVLIGKMTAGNRNFS
jgi:hypothetical protein